MNAKHTALPWKLFDMGSIVGHTEKKVIKKEQAFDWICSMQVSNCPNFEEDAAFICEACNGYEELKAQRDELLAAIKAITSKITPAGLSAVSMGGQCGLYFSKKELNDLLALENESR